MLSFRPDGAAQFRYRASFAETHFANISFFDPDWSLILFHLSLRAAEGIAVCNERGEGHHSWRSEIGTRVALPQDGTDVELVFEGNRVEVSVGGQRLFTFPSLPRPGRFARLREIAWVDFQGGIPAASIDIDHAPIGGAPAPFVDPRFTFRACLPLPPKIGSGLELVGEGDSEPVKVVTSPVVGNVQATDLWALVPGRVWDGLPDNAPLRLFLRGADGPLDLPPAVLGRDTVVDRAETYLSAHGADDAVLTLSFLEHLRSARVLDRLQARTRASLSRRLTRLGVTLPPELAEPVSAPPRPARTEDVQTERVALIRAHRAVDAIIAGANPAETPILPPCGTLDAAAERRILLSIAEAACHADVLSEVLESAGRNPFSSTPQGGSTWEKSGALPYLWQQGLFEEAGALLDEVSRIRDNAANTAAIGWLARQAIGDTRISFEKREGAVWAFIAYLKSRSGDYWGRNVCTEITRAAAALVVAAAPSLPGDLPRWARRAAIGACGLSPTFWRMVRKAAGDTPLCDDALAAGRAFDALLEAVEGNGGSVSAALDGLADHGCADLGQLRQELLGPSGVAVEADERLTAERLRAEIPDAGRAALRYLAFPGQKGNADLAALAAESIPRSYNQIVPAPDLDRQRSIVTAGRELVATTRDGSLLHDDELAGFAALCGALAGPVQAGFGHAIALATADALCRAGAGQQAGRLVSLLSQPGGTPSPGAVAALSSLADTAAMGSEAAAAILADLPGSWRPATPAAAADAWRADAHGTLCDTLVAIICCAPHLDSRAVAIRESWAAMLGRFGVPYLFVVGDGDGTRDGDVLRLEAPDDYEGLPRKTLALLRWFRDHTGFAHLMKVDDDCFLNVPLVFGDLNHRRFDYVGRSLLRLPGQTDRAWHSGRASSDRSRFEFDRSPEPSCYADGGTGYTLSRRAVAAALDAAASPIGQKLCAASFMEDKLVGDLLSLRGIAPNAEGYVTSVRRRAGAGLRPVSRWVNGFDPSCAAPVRLVHLDTHQGMHRLAAHLDSNALTPPKIWPGFSPPALGYNSNALEFVGTRDRLDAAREAEVAVVACLRNEMFMLPHFLAHYRALGVTAFLIADNLSDDGTLDYLAAQPDVALFSVDTEYSRSAYGVAWQQALLAAFRINRWTVVADADELLAWSPEARGNLPELLSDEAFAAADAARVFMLDLYPKGSLAEADFASGDPFAEAGFCDREPFLDHWQGRGPFTNAPTWTSALRHRLIPDSLPFQYVAQKVAVLRYRPWMRLSPGLHYVGDVQLARRELFFGHFKYNSAFHGKVEEEVARGQHFDNASEYRHYRALLASGRAGVYDPSVSVAWTEAPFVRDRLGPGPVATVLP
jgi:hypothetical protein